jgi:hypothetical protein
MAGNSVTRIWRWGAFCLVHFLELINTKGKNDYQTTTD